MPSNGTTYNRLRGGLLAEVGRIQDDRLSFWYGARDLATPNDLRRIQHRRELLVRIGCLIDKFEAQEREI